MRVRCTRVELDLINGLDIVFVHEGLIENDYVQLFSGTVREQLKRRPRNRRTVVQFSAALNGAVKYLWDSAQIDSFRLVWRQS